MALSEQDIEKLEELLFSEDIEEEALDYFGLHGLVCAAIFGPISIKIETIQTIVFGTLPTQFNQGQLSHFNRCVELISHELLEELNLGEELSLPFYEEDEHYEACLESWCTGFMEGFFFHEKSWFGKGEDVAAELLLPIMALSGLFDSNEFQEIIKNDKLMSQFEEIIPEQLVDIFLFYHSD
jgi:uncharacterized protein